MDIEKLIQLLPDQFVKHLNCALQPIVEYSNSSIMGYECLLRGHDSLNCNTPLRVFEKAQEFNLLLELELLVRRNAFAKFSSLADAHEQTLFLNLHCGLFQETDLLLLCTNELLLKYDLKPSNICFEVPEYDPLISKELFSESLMKIRQAGYSIALDDFGSGFSQMKALYDIRPDYIKIDRFFVSGIDKDSKKRLILSSIIDLSQVLGIRIVAEGIETREEYFTCRRLGCDLGQGYLLGRPEIELSKIGRLKFTWQKEDDTKRKDSNKVLRELVDQEVLKLKALHEDAPIKAVLDIFKENKQRIIPIMNALDKPLGIIHESAVISYLYMPFGQDLLANKTHKNRLRDFMKSCPARDIDAPVERIIDLKGDRLSDGLIVTKNGKYFGVLRPNSLVQISNEMRVQAAEDKNPLSKLPGNMAISSYVEEQCQKSHRRRHLCYVDFDFFKPFNDAYGFRLGDRAIQMFSEILRRHLTIDNVFLGHVGGDDFFVGFYGYGAERVTHMMGKIRADFANEVESLYEAKHRQQGYIVGKDRLGNIQQFPLLTCSIAILELPEAQCVNCHQEVGQIIAAAKSSSKRADGGLYFQKISNDSETYKCKGQNDSLNKLAG